MMRSREIILQLLHDPRFSIKDAQVWFIDRGAPGDTSLVSGEDIVSAESFFFKIATETGEKEIPYHRITRIIYQGRVLWELGMRRHEK